MKLPHLIRIVCLLALPLSFAARGSATPLHGKVVDILDGERITVISGIHPLKIKLLGIAAPAKGQPYSDIAAQHLSKLVAGKFVGAQCSGLAEDGYWRCRVTLDEMDVGEQMVRDGVAWYNKSDDSDLSEQERVAYLGSERAARTEARGIWQDATPTPPWDFRREQEIKQKLAASPLNEWAKSSNSSLSSTDLLRTKSVAKLGGKRRSVSLDPGWKTLAPKGGKFSVLIPGDAYEEGTIRPTPDGKMAELSFAGGQRGMASYVVVWGKGTPIEKSEEQLLDDIANGLVAGLEIGRNKFASDIKFEAKRHHSVKLGSYSGWQYNLTGPDTAGLIRVFTRRKGTELEIYVLGVLGGTEDDFQVREFLGSLSIDKF